MAAGLGFKTFTTGEVLTAADTNGYLMQGILVFASAAARDAAITSPQEGQFAYLKDTNVTTYYTGSAWANVDTTGMTNPMTTTGDIIYASSGSTPGRIGIGSTGNVLTVAGGIPSWAAPAGGGGLTQLATGSLTSTSVSITSYSSSYKHLQLWIYEMSADANGGFQMTFNTDTGSNYFYVQTDSRATDNDSASASAYINLQTEGNAGTSTKGTNVINIYNYASTASRKTIDGVYFGDRNTVGLKAGNLAGAWDNTSAITSIQVKPEPGNSFDNGTYVLYGVN